MNAMTFISRGLGRHYRRFLQEEYGATTVELAVVLPIFLLIFFGLIDFGRMAFHYVAAEKSMQVAARVAAVRAPACAGVPEFIGRGSSAVTPPPEFGTSCRTGANICEDPGVIKCDGDATNSTASEIWAIVRGALPNDAQISNLSFTYASDSNLGFLGGPYTPVVTVEIQQLDFSFVSPLADLVALTGALAPSGLVQTRAFPGLSVSLPAEDLAQGNNG